ncbi:MAG: hypothetical protein PHX04_06570 [Bacilli bacterium]|nr:hypothetical protein [Bacilli bacterium]
MKKKTKRKNYVFTVEFADEIAKRAIILQSSETKAVEYYLKLGFEVYDSNKESKEIISAINKLSREQKFIKKLLIQLFVNKKFASNRLEKEDETYQEFIKNKAKDKFID